MMLNYALPYVTYLMDSYITIYGVQVSTTANGAVFFYLEVEKLLLSQPAPPVQIQLSLLGTLELGLVEVADFLNHTLLNE